MMPPIARGWGREDKMLRLKQTKSDTVYILCTFKATRRAVIVLRQLQRKCPYVPVLLQNEETGEERYVPVLMLNLNWVVIRNLNPDWTDE